MQPWTPAFDPSTDSISSAPAYVRLSSLPLHFWGDVSLESIGNGLGKFLCRCPESKQAHSTFARICVEMNFNKGFPAEIILQGKDYSRNQKLDYENLCFRCRNSFETKHIARNCEKQPGKKRSTRSQRPTWWTGPSSEPLPENKAPEPAAEEEAEAVSKDTAKEKAPTEAERRKSPIPTQPASSWADIADEEDPRGRTDSQWIKATNGKPCQKRKKTINPEKM